MPNAPTVFRSSDALAPQLTGQVGSLIGVIDACIVNGYGAKAALGWTTEFTGANLRVYRNLSGLGGSGSRFRFDDTVTKTTLMRGAESASDVNTLINTFPDDTQSPDSAQQILKSDTTDSTVRDWVLIGDARRFYLGIDTRTATPRSYTWYFFGDYISHKPGDTTHALSFAGVGASGSGGITAYGTYTWSNTLVSIPTLYTTGWLARGYGGVVGAVRTTLTRLGGDAYLTSGLTYPGVIAGEFLCCRCSLNEGGVGIRGDMPGLFVSHHGNYFAGSGLDAVAMDSMPDMPGRTFLLFNCYFGYGQTSHVLLFETTGDSW